jgi:polysaccharide pyruvyl transferase CsaB
VLKTLAGCDLLISGGGSLLQDVSSFRSPLYYLGIIFIAKFLEKPVMIYAQGIGPLKRKINKRLASWILNKVDQITVRDQESKDDLLVLGVQKEITITADPVFGLPIDEVDEKVGREILARYGINRSEEVKEKLLGVYIRPWEQNEYLKDLVAALDIMSEKGWKIVFVPMQFPGDIGISRQAAKLLNKHDEAVVLKENYSTEEIMAITKNMDLLVGMRLHSLIMASTVGVPMVGLSYDPKIDRFLRQIGQVALVSTNNLNSQTLVEMLTWADEHREDIINDMKLSIVALHQKAWQNARITMNLLKDTTSNEMPDKQ